MNYSTLCFPLNHTHKSEHDNEQEVRVSEFFNTPQFLMLQQQEDLSISHSELSPPLSNTPLLNTTNLYTKLALNAMSLGEI